MAHGEVVDICSLKITKWQKKKTLSDLKGKCGPRETSTAGVEFKMEINTRRYEGEKNKMESLKSKRLAGWV